MFSPVHSAKPATCTLPSSSAKRKLQYGSSSLLGIAVRSSEEVKRPRRGRVAVAPFGLEHSLSSFSSLAPFLHRDRLGRALYRHVDELGGARGREAYLRYDLPGVNDIRRIRLGVALDEEGFLRLGPGERAAAEQVVQEYGQRGDDLLPQRGVVRLEHSPL